MFCCIIASFSILPILLIFNIINLRKFHKFLIPSWISWLFIYQTCRWRNVAVILTLKIKLSWVEHFVWLIFSASFVHYSLRLLIMFSNITYLGMPFPILSIWLIRRCANRIIRALVRLTHQYLSLFHSDCF